MRSLGKLLPVVVAVSSVAAIQYVDFSAVVNRTLCPAVRDVDVDIHRLPKAIRVTKCAEYPLENCYDYGVPPHECCQSRLGDQACVELQESLLVYYPREGKTRPYTVSVGCVCHIRAAKCGCKYDQV